MQTYPVPNMLCSSYMFIIHNPHFAALLSRCIGDKKCVDSNRRRHFNFWHTFTTSQSEETWNHTQKSQKQCPVSYSLRAQRTSLAPVCVSGIPQFTFPIFTGGLREGWVREYFNTRGTIKCSKIRPKSKSSMCWDLTSHKKKTWGSSPWSWTKISGDTALDMLISDKMTETSFNHLFTFEEKNNMAQISQVSMDCQLALLSSAMADLAVFCSICFWKMPGFQRFPTKVWTLPSSFRWETIASLKPFLEVFCCKNRASWHRDLVVEVLYSHAESALKQDWYLNQISPGSKRGSQAE